MSDVIVQLPLDKTGRDPNNLVGSEEATLTPISGFPFKMVTMYHGGFYVNSLRVYDSRYIPLVRDKDYIVTYYHKQASEFYGLDIASGIVFLDRTRTGKVYMSAQMVGGDVAFSFTVIEDYVNFWKTKPSDYIPKWLDYNGTEPIYGPGELAALRWRLDTYQPFNNEIENISRAITGQLGNTEAEFRVDVKAEYDRFLQRFNNRLDLHIQDKANPHVDTKEHVGLGLVENYRVASLAEAIAGVSNELYLTPQLSAAEVNKLGGDPLQAHIDARGNVHGVTNAQLNTNSKQEVNALANTKYLRNEVVENSNLGFWLNQDMTYNQILQLYRKDIPANAFTNYDQGKLPLGRLGRGILNNRAVLDNNRNWTNIDALLSLLPQGGSGDVAFASFSVNITQAQANAMVATTPPFSNMRLNSIVFYYIRETKAWGSGNGAWNGVYDILYASMNIPGQGWVPI